MLPETQTLKRFKKKKLTRTHSGAIEAHFIFPQKWLYCADHLLQWLRRAPAMNKNQNWPSLFIPIWEGEKWNISHESASSTHCLHNLSTAWDRQKIIRKRKAPKKRRDKESDKRKSGHSFVSKESTTDQSTSMHKMNDPATSLSSL